VVLGCSPSRAHTLADTALVLTEQLPTTWAALADGRIDLPRARAIAKALGWQIPQVPAGVAAACGDAADCYARMWKADGDPRPIGQLRTLVAADLMLRPWDTAREPGHRARHRGRASRVPGWSRCW
jgi:hypothetical protein